MELDPQDGTVEIAIGVEQVDLEHHLLAAGARVRIGAEGRVETEVRGGRKRRSQSRWMECKAAGGVYWPMRRSPALLNARPDRVDAHFRQEFRRGADVRGGKAEFAPAAFAADDLAVQVEGAPEERGRGLHAPFQRELAHLRRGYDESVHGDRQNDVETDAALGKLAPERLDGPLAVATVGEVGADDDLGGARLRHPLDEVARGERGENAIEGLLDEDVETGCGAQLALAIESRDPGRGVVGSEELRRVRLASGG